jgi:peptidoglycan/xylan/chitin deacetylase (PgdA/CDA1 family)
MHSWIVIGLLVLKSSTWVHAEILPVSINPPSGLDPQDVPQMILITFDDAVNQPVYERINLIRGHNNPDGSPIAFTFFVSNNYTNYWQLHELHSHGHEIAIHTVTHSTGSGTNYERWIEEMVACREAISRLAGIPLEQLRGFRAPYLGVNSHMYHALSDLGFDYDCSVPDVPGQMLSQDESSFIWPYTLHDGIQQLVWSGTGPTNPLPDLFKVPMWNLVEPDGSRLHNMDPTGTREELVALFKHNLLSRYNGNRAPMGIWLHASPFLNTNENVAAMNEFLEWALEIPDVWVVGVGNAVDWMKNPVASATVLAESSLTNAIYETIPDAEAFQVNFAFGPVRAITQPLAYPDYHTVFLEQMEVPDVVVEFVPTSIWGASFQAELHVTHNHPVPFSNWQIILDLGDAELTGAWNGAVYRQLDDGTYLLGPSSSGSNIPQGQTTVATMGITGSPDDLISISGSFYTAGYVDPVLSVESTADPNTLRLTWNKTSSIYDLEVAANSDGPWSLQQTIYGKEYVEVERPNGDAFFRLRDNQQSLSEPLLLSGQPLLLSLSVEYDDRGTVQADPLREEYLLDEAVTITATAAEGYAFVAWSGDASGNENPLTVSMNAPLAIQAIFEPLVHQVTFDAGELGTHAGGGPLIQHITHGGTVELPIIVPAPGWLFDGWDEVAETITSASTFTAEFIPDHNDDDDDGLSNYEEIVLYGTDPHNPDTSGDGILDGEAIAGGLNPLTDHRNIIAFIADEPERFGIVAEDANNIRQQGINDVLENPAAFGLHSEASIMDLNLGGLMLRRGAQGFELEFQLEMSTDLINWHPVETITRQLAPAGEKVFLRVRARSAPDENP